MPRAGSIMGSEESECLIAKGFRLSTSSRDLLVNDSYRWMADE